MKDFLRFHTMITPILIEVIFWLSVVFALFAGIYIIITNHNWSIGLQILILGPLLMRVLCEMMIVLFKINDSLKTISQKLNNIPE